MKTFASASTLLFFLLLLSSNVMSLSKQVLYSSETLKSGDSLRSGGLVLTMQKDCNLVLRKDGSRKVLWESHSAKGHHQHCTLHLTNHGALEIKNGNHIIWNTKTNNEGYKDVYILVLMPPNAMEVVNGYEVVWSSAFWEP